MLGQKPKILIHVCCAVCGAAVTEVLKEKFSPMIFFYNPNIHPRQEYEKRRDSARMLAHIYGLDFFEGEYDTENWFKSIKGLENEPEGGKRCDKCFKLRLEKARYFAKSKNIDFFTTTLSLSPFKNEETIKQVVGSQFGKPDFCDTLELGINKKENWQKTRALAKKYGFYHQKYCGCVYSMPKTHE